MEKTELSRGGSAGQQALTNRAQSSGTGGERRCINEVPGAVCLLPAPRGCPYSSIMRQRAISQDILPSPHVPRTQALEINLLVLEASRPARPGAPPLPEEPSAQRQTQICYRGRASVTGLLPAALTGRGAVSGDHLGPGPPHTSQDPSLKVPDSPFPRRGCCGPGSGPPDAPRGYGAGQQLGPKIWAGSLFSKLS